MKQCLSCDKNLDIFEFYNINSPDDTEYQVSCKKCRQEGKDMKHLFQDNEEVQDDRGTTNRTRYGFSKARGNSQQGY